MEVVNWVANLRGVSEDYLESHYTIEQISLLYYLGMKSQAKESDRQSKLTAAYLSEKIAQMFSPQ